MQGIWLVEITDKYYPTQYRPLDSYSDKTQLLLKEARKIINSDWAMELVYADIYRIHQHKYFAPELEEAVTTGGNSSQP